MSLVVKIESNGFFCLKGVILNLFKMHYLSPLATEKFPNFSFENMGRTFLLIFFFTTFATVLVYFARKPIEFSTKYVKFKKIGGPGKILVVRTPARARKSDEIRSIR